MSARLEVAEAEAYGSLVECAGLPVLRLAGAVCIAHPELRDDATLNRVGGLGLERAPSEEELDEIERFFRAVPTRYAVSVSPFADPSLADRLRRRGFGDGYAWMKFRRGVEAPATVTTELTVRATTDGASFGRVVALAFGMSSAAAGLFAGPGEHPAWTLFLAFERNEPVAGAALFAHDGVGWLGAAGTLPGRRGKGAQGALLAARIACAAELGLEAVTTETGERVPGRSSASYRNILRAGFAEAYVRPNLLAPP